jgi:hypothetical protein
MALKSTTIDKLKAVYGLDVDALINAIKSEEEIDLELPEVVVMSQADLETRDANKVTAGKTDGEKEARNTLIKEVAKRLNIEVRGERIGDLVTAIEKVKNTSDDQKVQMLTEQINNLQRDKETLSKDLELSRSQADEARFDSDLIASFPVHRTSDLSDRERLLLLKANMKFETVDGKLVAKRNGEVLRDGKTQNPLGLNDVVNTFFSEKKWVSDGTGSQQQQQQQGGRGGKDNPPPQGGGSAGVRKMSQFKEKWLAENQNANTMSPEFTAAVSKHAKEVTDFDWHN